MDGIIVKDMIPERIYWGIQKKEGGRL